jgi:hypothetical protein
MGEKAPGIVLREAIAFAETPDQVSLQRVGGKGQGRFEGIADIIAR